MAEDLIRYDILAQDALRNVVRKVLAEVAKTGLPGEHHFYITFATHAPGVRVSSRLLSDYPEDMTIVLQHQYWDLSVSEQAFEVGLSFNGVPERLLVPFTAVKGFVDPSVQFGLQFETVPRKDDAADGRPVLLDEGEQSLPVASEPAVSEPAVSEPAGTLPVAEPAAEPEPTATPDNDANEVEDDAEEPPAEAEVVSLDAFRKKQ